MDDQTHRLDAIVSRCKASVHLTVNDHKAIYQDVATYFERMAHFDSDEIEPEVFSGMVERDTIVCLQFYPLSPVGFCRVWHYSIDEAIRITLEILGEEEANND